MSNVILRPVKQFIREHFDLRKEKEDDLETIDSIKRSVEFRGTNLWVLIFAIFLASLGLNTNSTAVIIGAMLISPLMGPTMGFGLALGILDFDLLKRSLRNFTTATIFSILTSTLFFLISPFSEAQSELLARTSPTVFDVLIAFFGGLAGIVASASKSKGNVLAGVAIATALMPPLCTAGFGLATGNFHYFFGAMYLYFINMVFISLATYLIVRLLKYPTKEFLDKKREATVKRYIIIMVLCTTIPSVYLSYRILQKTIFEQKARTFISNELTFPNTQIISKNITYSSDNSEIKVVLIGESVPQMSITTARAKLPSYGLKKTSLLLQQGFGQESTDINELKSMLMQDLYKNSEEVILQQIQQIDSLRQELSNMQRATEMTQTITPEIKVLYPHISEVSCTPTYLVDVKSSEQQSIILVYIKSRKTIKEEEQRKIKEWLSARTKVENIKLIIEKI